MSNAGIEFAEKVKEIWLSDAVSLDEVLKATIDFMDHFESLDEPSYDQVFVAGMLRYLLDSQLNDLTHSGGRSNT